MVVTSGFADLSDERLAFVLGQRVGQLLVLVEDPSYPRQALRGWTLELAELCSEACKRLT